MKLYEINTILNQILDNGFYVDEETGEVFDSSEDIENLEIARDEKLEGIICYIKNYSADIDALKAEEKSLAERRKAKEKKVESLKKYLSENCPEGFESAKCKLSYRKSEQVEVDENLDSKWMVEKVEVKPDKTAIKKALKSGEEIVGAWIVENYNPQIK